MLEVRLLGQFDVRLDGQPVEIPSRPAQSLLAYLILSAGTAHRREKLAGLFWPEATESNARNNLRRALWRIRKAIRAGGREYLLADEISIAFDANSAYWLDASLLASAVATGWSVDGLMGIVSVYHGELLPGFYDEWVLLERERLQAVVDHKMQMLLDRLVEDQQWSDVLEWGERWIAQGHAPEPAYRALMIAHNGLGDSSSVAAVFQRCVGSLRRELGVEPSQQTRAVYERLSRGETGTGAPVQSAFADRPQITLEPPFSRLPVPATPFIGREVELAEIATRLADPACRLLSLIGPGGIGKTRLCLQAATAQLDRFRDGVFFVPLESLSSPQFVAPAIADALNFSLQGPQTPEQQIADYLRGKNVLLVLDNFEHVIEAAELVADLLQACLGLKILTTSHERLNLAEEWVFPIQGFEIPSETSVDNLEACSAAQLFLQRARQVKPGFAPAVADRLAIARTCRLVNGLPLGIELAAAWVKMMPCAEIAKEVERNLDFLSTSLHNVPERQRNLRAVFEYSWDRLTEEERRAFRQLAVFRGGFRREAAEAVLGEGQLVTSDESRRSSPVTHLATLATLSSLVDKSLLRVTESGRYDRHPLVYQYATEKLDAAAGEKDRVREHHGRYYAAFLEQRATNLKGAGQKEALAEIDEEIENMRLAWRWAIEGDHVIEIGRCLEGLASFYDTRGWYQEGEAAFEQAATALHSSSQAGEDWGESDVLGSVLARQGMCCFYLGRYDQARDLLERSLALLRSTGAHEEIAYALYFLGGVAVRRGDYARAKMLFQDSQTVARTGGERWLYGRALIALGSVANSLGEHSEAIGLLQESLAIFTEIGERRFMAAVLNELGIAVGQSGSPADARRFDEECLAIARELGDRRLTVIASNNLAWNLHELGQSAAAEPYLLESLGIAREIGDRAAMVVILNSLGDVTCALGDYQASKNHFHEALTLAAEIRFAPQILYSLVGLANRLSKQGDAPRAVELLVHPLRHPAVEQVDKTRAERLLAELRPKLSPSAFDSAWERGQARTLMDVIEEELGDTLRESLRLALDTSAS